MATKINSIKKVDKITTVTHLAGAFNLAAGAILTIGGLQYTTDAVKTVLLSSITPVGTTRYQIYAVISGGDVILVLSTNQNSTGPAGYTSWKLVGSFYTNGLAIVAFGAFVNIKGRPKTDRKIQYLGQIVDATNTQVTSASPVTNAYYWEQDGSQALYAGAYYHTGVVGTNGSAQYYVKPPSGHIFINDALGAGNTPSGIGTAQGDVGGGDFLQGSRGGIVNSTFQGFSLRGVTPTDGGNWGPAGAGGVIDGWAMNVANMAMAWDRIAITVAGFSDTPIEDL